jgi:DNA polymerase I
MLSQDPSLIEAFKHGEDIHARTARFLFPDSPTISTEQRRTAKAVNFGVVYGITGFGLSKMIGASPKEASIYIDTFFEKYPGVKAYQERIIEFGRTNGFVETLEGRRRYIKGLTDANSMIRSGAEREAINMPVQ